MGATKRTKRQLVSTVDAMHGYVSGHKATSREGYYVMIGATRVMRLVHELMHGRYDHSLYAPDGGWAETDEQFGAAMVRMLATDLDAATGAGRAMEPLHRREWTEADDAR